MAKRVSITKEKRKDRTYNYVYFRLPADTQVGQYIYEELQRLDIKPCTFLEQLIREYRAKQEKGHKVT